MNITANSHHVYLVGIKGVALAALAELLNDAGWQISGSDVEEDFVTAPILKRIGVRVDSFSAPIPAHTDLVVYTGAHQASAHPQVVAAKQRGIRCLSHAEALAEWSNQKKSIAVCGVGGKSSISAMIAWVLEKTGKQPSFAVGVGGIKQLDKAGQWKPLGEYCVVEADEYATDPTAVKAGSPLVPRFHFFRPEIIVATSIVYDHPDVYMDENHTWNVFCEWFSRQKDTGMLISHDSNNVELSKRLPHKRVSYFGQQEDADVRLQQISLEEGKSIGTITYKGESFKLELRLPGVYNLENACAAFLACVACNVPPQEICTALRSFASTVRRFEYRGEYHGAALYDDYGHHPRELAAVFFAAQAFVGKRKLLVAFQPHTFTRTKALWNDFVNVLATIPNLYLLKIFASARESFDESISVAKLREAIIQKNPSSTVTVVESVEKLAIEIAPKLTSDVVFLTIGAGNIYQIHDVLLNKSHD